MFKEKYKVIGVMSGTSLDGVDLAYIDFTIQNNKWDLKSYTLKPYPTPLTVKQIENNSISQECSSRKKNKTTRNGFDYF
jgi:1,6-anhydro-N-acetylmuramate kinase